MTSAEIFDAGYALMLYNIDSDVYTWRYRDKDYRTFSSCPNTLMDDLRVARIEDVKANAI